MTDNGGGGSTTRLKTFVAVRAGELKSATCTVKSEVPAAVGVPEITPVLLFSEIPAGSPPLVILHLYGFIPPVAASVVAVYAAFWVPFGSDEVVMDGAGTTVMATDADFVLSAAEVAVTVTARLDETDAGALYVTEVAVTLLSVPHALPVHPLPESNHMTP